MYRAVGGWMLQMLWDQGDVNKGRVSSVYTAILQGFVAMVLFSLTVPMTKLALLQFSPEFITASRGLGAGVLAMLVVNWHRWPLPSKKECGWLLLSGAAVIIGYPYLLAKTMTSISAANMGIILAGLPLATAVAAVFILRESYRLQFWLCAVTGAGVLVFYYQQHVLSSSMVLPPVYLLLFTVGVLACGGIGYAGGAKVAATMGAWPAICWMLVLYLPLSALGFGYFYAEKSMGEALINNHSILSAFFSLRVMAYLGLLYLAVVSQWWGFKYWYQAMTVAGVGAISQLQLIQPFFTLVFSALLLSEALTFSQCIYAGLIMVIVAAALKFR